MALMTGEILESQLRIGWHVNITASGKLVTGFDAYRFKTLEAIVVFLVAACSCL